MDLDSLITKCENELYLGFTYVESSGLNWLNKVCAELSSICRCLQQSLASKTNKNPNAIETSLLCTSQIVCCIKYLEKALTIEEKDKIVLAPTRQFFLDRIMWCLSHIKTISDSCTVTDTNFVHLMDVALDLLAPLTLFGSESNTTNIAEHHAEASIESGKIRSVVDSIIGQVLNFVNVTSDDDKKPLTCMCQKVLRDSIAFEEACSLLKGIPDEQNRRLKAATLENSLYQLDRWVNDSLLKLVFTVFVEMKADPVQKLKDLCERGSAQDEIDKQTEGIDGIYEKIVQIGTFAMSFSWDYKTKSNLQSSLASLEALDSFLIPAILSHSKIHSILLQSHWNDEIGVLIHSIQNIIDTQAFCSCIIDIFSTSINSLTQTFDKEIVQNLLFQCDVLNQHFQINYNDLELGTESPRSLYLKDFHLMIKECNAALVLCKEDEKNRIIKRVKILLSVLKKFHSTLKAHDEPKEAKNLTFGEVTMPATKLSLNIKTRTESMEVLRSDTVRTEHFFESMGIAATPTKKLLYESKREKSTARKPTILDSTFKIKTNSEDIHDKDNSKPFTPSRRIQRRPSLRRVALFKQRSKESEAKQYEDAYNDDTLDLHITDILDQITDLSNTLSCNRMSLEQNSDLV
ncbi:serendipity locus protein alpha-like [Bradysia coprophila]|uniref:serendipity locus protein alpha-like n=1 Tax=Bradysia coprophila TaxID=38358 RepID=UPI00187DAF84|nr:serendipity locus protein alpha-like [Bradysia coprophila]